MVNNTRRVRCPICNKIVPCIGNFATLYCLALHIVAKWDDEPHVKWREEHGIAPVVYQSMLQVQTMARQIMTFLPQVPDA